MYTHIWNKYLLVIRILLKKSVNNAQSLSFNVSDFEKIGPQKKTGFNFTLEFRNGRLDNSTSLSQPAKELAAVLLQDTLTGNLLKGGDYNLTMSAKFVLNIELLSSYQEKSQLAEIAEETV